VILIAIGANLPGPSGETPLETCRAAAAAVGRIAGLTVVSISSWYRSAPVPPSGQPDYVNGVARLSGAIGPEALLAATQAIEAGFGRRRSVANAARTLDLDIIDLNGLVRPGPDPILPHPRAHLRSFVLLPVRDVAPGWVCPGLGEDVQTLLARAGMEGISRLDDA
jgi:2-amino-4-hydroxy-6-hydroxymethyldihydropteridine diphosphokinase